MLISEVISLLEKAKNMYGDLPVTFPAEHPLFTHNTPSGVIPNVDLDGNKSVRFTEALFIFPKADKLRLNSFELRG